MTPQTFEIWLKEHRSEILQILLKKKISKERAEDAIQDESIKMWNYPKLNTIKNLKPYFFKMVLFRAYNLARETYREDLTGNFEDVRLVYLDDPFKQLDAKQRKGLFAKEVHRLHKKINNLPPKQQSAVKRHYLEEEPVSINSPGYETLKQNWKLGLCRLKATMVELDKDLYFLGEE